MENKKTFYLGSGDFSSKVLEKIHGHFNNLSVVSQKNYKLPIIKKAKELASKVFVINNKQELEQLLAIEKPQIIIVCDFGIIITEKILKDNDPIINIHPSILPKYRGCSPIISSIINGDKKTGVSLMKMEKGVDEGPVYRIKEVSIQDKDDIDTLTDKLSEIASKLLISNVNDIINKKLNPKKQKHIDAICTKMISKQQGLLNTKENAITIERKIRAYKIWPGVFTYFYANNKKMLIRILDAEVKKINGSAKLYIEKDSIDLKTSKDYLSIKRIKPEGKKEMSVKEFLCGYKNISL
ncbi:methionyl-tRNA formyltransferase [bacterium]|nr:methionyl-tRNA formyltransferase [bacterium]